MGKKKNNTTLGRSLIKDKFSGRRRRKGDEEFGSLRHTSEINDGYDWGRLNLQSVTEQSNLDDFLATAELAGTEFTAEKLNIAFVNPQVGKGLLSDEERCKIENVQKENRQFLKIPRRPPWNSSTSSDELQQNERESFLEWRRGLAELQEINGLLLTPFEKNLEFWRQLWRVIERSDVVVQIVDARNPLLFRCEDLERYVEEVDENKMNMILINKADFLTPKQREAWADYFERIGLPVVFFSALNEYGTYDEDDEEQVDNEDTITSDAKFENEDKLVKEDDVVAKTKEVNTATTSLPTENKLSSLSLSTNGRSKLYSREELIHYFKTVHKGRKVQDNVTTIGLVGYPNVGKSSTINAILSVKKVSVSATPGKTKHFQTLFVDNELCLCDCPGLVMPTFVSTKGEMIISGILPIDQMRDHIEPINLVISHIPRHVLEDTYGVNIPKPLEEEDSTRLPTAEEFLNSYGYMRGFMTQRGLPDGQRSARYILKDYVKGKLLYCHAPPPLSQKDYHHFPTAIQKDTSNIMTSQMKTFQTKKLTPKELDNAFFSQHSQGVHFKDSPGGRGMTNALGSSSTTNSTLSLESKEWKKHRNRNKREKLRRVYTHLDQ